MNGETFRVCGPPSALGSSEQPQRSLIVWLGSRRPAIAVFKIDKLGIWTIQVTIRSIVSSSASWCPEHSRVLLLPTLIPAMLGSTLLMVMLDGSTTEFVEASHCTNIGEDL